MSAGRPNESSEAARLGTAAHGLGEYCLRNRVEPLSMVGGMVTLDEHEDAVVYTAEEVRSALGDGDTTVDLVALFTSAESDRYPIDENMADAVQVYYATVMDELESRPGAELLVEHRTGLSHLVGYDWDEGAYLAHVAAGNDGALYASPNGMHLNGDGVLCNADGTKSAGPMFGTNDAAVFQAFKHLTIIDYKHGQGVVVEVSEAVGTEAVIGEDGLVDVPVVRGNSQLMQYALGIAESPEIAWAFDTLDLVIVQPRARHGEGGVRRFSTNRSALQDFKMQLVEAAHAVERPDAPLAAGTWCQFCPAAGIPCPELHASVVRQAAIDFSDGEPTVRQVDESTPEPDLEQALAIVPLLDVYTKKVRAEAMRRLRESEDGTGFGYKLVRGKSNRRWLGEQAVAAEELVGKGFPRELLFQEPKMKTPAQVEALRPPALIALLKDLGVKAPVGAIKAMVAELAHKPEGKIVVAAMDDPRDPVAPTTAAAADFEAFEGED